ncbi:MAG: transcriptional regulator [FCB group bacterium]|nr:transcriptional regulator [FCB group bacterium]MBL7028050.1 transcriptional regulator [Candidatus Neomarinimicrobiota bacterium]MBL7122788.1 transcriptional regulator [Candidatus Neomarinimicrobiota bacterium]
MTDFDYQQIDDLIHSRIRLAVMAALAAMGPATFTLIKEKVGATDGNLSVHMRKLEDAGYLDVEKSFIDRKPVSIYRLTTSGKTALKAYIQYLENMLPLKGTED